MPRSSPPRLNLPGQSLVPEDVVVWNWPLRDEGLKSWAMVVGAIAIIALVWAVWGSISFTLITAAALTVSLWRLWLPLKWELGLTGVTMVVLGFRRRIPWLAVAKFELGRDGVWLFADREAAPERATFIGYADQRQRITACVEYYLGAWTAASESTRSFQ